MELLICSVPVRMSADNQHTELRAPFVCELFPNERDNQSVHWLEAQSPLVPGDPMRQGDPVATINFTKQHVIVCFCHNEKEQNNIIK